MQREAYDYLFNLLLIGDTSVGKLALISRFVKNRFGDQEPPTLGFTNRTSFIEIEGKKIKLDIWHTGSTGYAGISSISRKAQGILLVYDITRRKTLEGIRQWIHEIKWHAPEDVQIMLLGNKCDLRHQREVSIEQGAQLANEHGIKFMEVSAKENINVYDAFVTLARDILTVQEPKRVAEEQERFAKACLLVSKKSSNGKCNIL